MFDKFKQVSEAMKMKGQLREIQKQLSAEKIEIEEDGIRVVVTGEQKIKELVVKGNDEYQLREIINKALDKSREVAAKKTQDAFGDLSKLLG